MLNKHGEPVLTGALEAFVTDYERNQDKVIISRTELSGKKMAIVGPVPFLRIARRCLTKELL